jgi:hypothetical protein
MSVEDQQLDSYFSQIASTQKGIKPLLESFFGFLKRKTDFYVTYEEGCESSMGFPKGVAEKMVLTAMKKYKFNPVEDSLNSNEKVSNEPKILSNKPIQLNYTDSGKLIPIGNGGISRDGR